jgi:hypothetical protein
MKVDWIVSNKKGVTLIEILISFIILCVAAIGAAGIISHGHRATGQDFRRGEALQLLVDRMNFLSSISFENLKSEIGGGTTHKIDKAFRDVPFGTVSVGKNTYSVEAVLKLQSITFDNLMELEFPNSEYDYKNPKTWRFQNKTNSSESFNQTTGDYKYSTIKIKVSVKPTSIKGKDERAYEAITFVCDTE